MDDAALLYVSDDPEKFLDHGELFDALAAADVVRLLLDHVNGMGVPMRVMAFATNVGGPPVTLAWFGAAGGPDANGMEVGHAATSRFLYAKELPGSELQRLELAAGASGVLLNDVLSPGQCCAGIFDLEIPIGADVRLRVVACDPSHTTPGVFAELPVAPDDGAQRRGVFVISDAPAATINWSGGSAEIEIGRAPHQRWEHDPYTGPPLKGEYGVIRRFACNLSNPNDSPLSFAIYGTPRAGSATGSYVIDGECVGCHGVDAFQRFKITSGVLGPGANRIVRLSTMPDINSNLPFVFTIGADDQTVADAFASESPLYRDTA